MENKASVWEKMALLPDFRSLSSFISDVAHSNSTLQRPRVPGQRRSEILSALQVAGYTSKHLVHSAQDH